MDEIDRDTLIRVLYDLSFRYPNDIASITDALLHYYSIKGKRIHSQTHEENGYVADSFYKELISLLNKHSIDVYCSTPDYILSNLIIAHLHTQRSVMEALVEWTK